jgi:hypothetical protein
MSLRNLDFIQKYLRSPINGTKEYKSDLINQLNEKYKNKHNIENTKTVIKHLKKARGTGLAYHTIRNGGVIDLLRLYLDTPSSGLGLVLVKTNLMGLGRFSHETPNRPQKLPNKTNNSYSSAPINIPKRKKTLRKKLTFN